MLVWCIVSMFLLAAAIMLAPRKGPYVPTPEEALEIKKKEYKLYLKGEKDTKRFYEDIRGLYPL